MTRAVTFPLATAALLAVWLLLNQTLSPGGVIVGAVLALAGARMLSRVQPETARLRRFGAVLRLATNVVPDIIRSNVAVGLIVLGLGRRSRTSGFVEIPLDLRNPYGLAVLASIITATPGTLWVGFDPLRGVLEIHVLDLIDEDGWVRTIKGRYERWLLEIFE